MKSNVKRQFENVLRNSKENEEPKNPKNMIYGNVLKGKFHFLYSIQF